VTCRCRDRPRHAQQRDDDHDRCAADAEDIRNLASYLQGLR
jgi:hypothetical protein